MKIQIVKKADKKIAPSGCAWVIEQPVEPRT